MTVTVIHSLAGSGLYANLRTVRQMAGDHQATETSHNHTQLLSINEND